MDSGDENQADSTSLLQDRTGSGLSKKPMPLPRLLALPGSLERRRRRPDPGKLRARHAANGNRAARPAYKYAVAMPAMKAGIIFSANGQPFRGLQG